MNDQTGFYPWLTDWRILVEIFVGGLAFAAALYLAARSGRVEKHIKEDPGQRPLHHYAGILSSDAHPPTLFLWLLIVFLGFWAIGYTFWVAVHGLGY